ncbi:MAG: hypothetical protein H7330_15385 [Hymenobacteraceae bacterium]|nr:hypothetical protein [Hymenobacteraceae bacterium]
MRFLYPAALPALLFLLPLTPARAQTSPAPFTFSNGAGTYLFSAWDPAAPAGTYPPNMVFHWFNAAAPTARQEPAGNWSCPYNLTTRPRILGRDSLGVSFVNTSSAQFDDCTAGTNTLGIYAGEAVLALNTTGLSAVQLSWQGRMLSAQQYAVGTQTRIYGLEMQYRVGTSGAFTPLPNQRFVAGDSVAAAYPPQGTRQAFRIALPAAALGQPVVEVRWVYHSRGGANGQRPELSLDEIRAAATFQPTGLTAETAALRASLRVVPNPLTENAEGTVRFTTTQPLAAGAVELVDGRGRSIQKINAQVALPAGAHELPLPSGLPAGLYYVRIGAVGAAVVVGR